MKIHMSFEVLCRQDIFLFIFLFPLYIIQHVLKISFVIKKY